ncbi:hypothetical protein [Micromonospora tarensis]|uniref:Uncharacterized protein n=1 Tax=Micromonospora tarensis TaxID=2806100 RepID=A0ABS1YA46_9ACTN|nr:hypothetical protein [Micromonospora tarensis]MBM0274111.1 hypothetical protein [Micromonospora tarensis]
MSIDVAALRVLINEADRAPWTAHPDGLVWSEQIGDPVSGSAQVENAVFIAEARNVMPALCDELEAFQPVIFSDGSQMFIHECRHIEWWNEKAQGPVNDQGCDACESSPFADGWQPVYVRKAADR